MSLKQNRTITIDDDFGLILNCAVRYALGRRTYMPSSVIRYITPLLTNLNDRTIDVFIQDIERYKTDVDKGIGSWGMNIDKEDWLRFLSKCKDEMNKRNETKTNQKYFL